MGMDSYEAPNEMEFDEFHITGELRRFACLNAHSNLLQSCCFLLETRHLVLKFSAFLQL